MPAILTSDFLIYTPLSVVFCASVCPSVPPAPSAAGRRALRPVREHRLLTRNRTAAPEHFVVLAKARVTRVQLDATFLKMRNIYS